MDPVSEHEAALAAARQVDEAMVERGARALCAESNRRARLADEAEGRKWYEERALRYEDWREEFVAQARVVLLAARTPEREEEAMSEIPRPPFRTPCQYCGTLIPANGVCPRCAPSDVRARLEAESDRLENNAMLCRFPECAYEQEALEADLAALREAAQAVAIVALRAVLASADSEEATDA